MTASTIPFQTAGTVDIQELVIFTNTGKFLDIKDYLSELNIYEDIFSPTMHGDFLFVDSRNLIKELPIVGEEYLYVKLTTPSTEKNIEKIFRIYSITDRELANDRGAFGSPPTTVDHLDFYFFGTGYFRSLLVV